MQTESGEAKPRQAQPVDKAVVAMIREANRDGDGFTLGLEREMKPEEKRLSISVSRPVPPRRRPT